MQLAKRVLDALWKEGVREICLCAGSRNHDFVKLLQSEQFEVFHWFEERSAAFFALGKAKKERRPVAVVTTSGTAAGELMPAIMEAAFSCVPLIAVTADRPRRMRGTGAPQAAIQDNLYGKYTPSWYDLEGDEEIDLSRWRQVAPLHINVCLEDPIRGKPPGERRSPRYEEFFTTVQKPVVIVSEVQSELREAVVEFLLKMNAPTYLEAISGLREDQRLSGIQWRSEEGFLEGCDGVLRIGTVPTAKCWRDLESRPELPVCVISHQPFTGIEGAELVLHPIFMVEPGKYEMWKKEERKELELDPESEPGLIHELSKKIPSESFVYLGNSLPIREWNAYATYDIPHPNIGANRGLNGIDGQLSSFFGMLKEGVENWGIFGDLTTLYDLAAPWILPQISHYNVKIVVVNNGGGKIFSNLFPDKEFQNEHQIGFEHFAKMWGIDLVELIPNQTVRS